MKMDVEGEAGGVEPHIFPEKSNLIKRISIFSI